VLVLGAPWWAGASYAAITNAVDPRIGVVLHDAALAALARGGLGRPLRSQTVSGLPLVSPGCSGHLVERPSFSGGTTVAAFVQRQSHGSRLKALSVEQASRSNQART
jgi:hypothetical protein